MRTGPPEPPAALRRDCAEAAERFDAILGAAN
jgi:hypothetical protein